MFLWAGPLIALSWLTLALVNLDALRHSARAWETCVMGYFFGSLFAHATLAAAWTAFGLGPLTLRLPLSLAWVGSLPVAIGINVETNGGPRDAVLVVGGSLLGQWLLLQLPLWGLALGFALRLRHIDEVDQAASRHLQFGIRQLLIVTAIVAVVLAIGRAVLPHMPTAGSEMSIFIFLAAAAIVLTLPLLLAALMRRRAVLGVLLALGLMGMVTALEMPLLNAFRLRGPEPEHFVAINAASAVVILLFALMARFNGYRLDTRRTTAKSENAANGTQ